jgi:hypothetical protein
MVWWRMAGVWAGAVHMVLPAPGQECVCHGVVCRVLETGTFFLWIKSTSEVPYGFSAIKKTNIMFMVLGKLEYLGQK